MIVLNTKYIELLKYLIVGGINTLFGYSIFAVFLFYGFHYTLAVLFATILGVLFNFQSYGRIVFKNHSWALLTKFILIYLIIYLVNILLLIVFDFFVSNLYMSGAMVIPLIAYFGYLLNKRYVWKKS